MERYYSKLEKIFLDEHERKHDNAPTYADAIKWAYGRQIDQACEWLRCNLFYETKVHADGTIKLRQREEIIKRFKKEMEE